MESDKIVKVLTTIFGKKYPEIEFKCEITENVQSGHRWSVWHKGKLIDVTCKAPKKFYETTDMKDAEPQIRNILKMMGVEGHIRVFFVH